MDKVALTIHKSLKISDFIFNLDMFRTDSILVKYAPFSSFIFILSKQLVSTFCKMIRIVK